MFFLAGSTKLSGVEVTIPAENMTAYSNDDGGTTIASKSVTAGSTLPLTENPIKDMYTFVGWGTSPGGAVVYSPGSSIVVTANITLYAVYEADY